MRLFIALSLPEAVVAELAATQQRLRRGARHPVRWVAPETMHLTLQFLGEVEGGRAPALLAAVAAARAAEPGPLELRLAPAGVFPSPRRPRVVWAGVAGDMAGLARLAGALADAIAPLGLAVERRPLRPHLTLGRARDGAAEAELAALGAAVAALPPPAPLTWLGGPARLYQSTLTPAGPIYRALGE